MSIPVNISIDRLKRIGVLWNNFKYHTSQIYNGIISGIVCIIFPFIAMSILKDKTDPIIMVLALLGIVFISVGVYNLVRAKNYKMELNLWDQKEVEDFENLVDYFNSLNLTAVIFTSIIFKNLQIKAAKLICGLLPFMKTTYFFFVSLKEKSIFAPKDLLQ